MNLKNWNKMNHCFHQYILLIIVSILTVQNAFSQTDSSRVILSETFRISNAKPISYNRGTLIEIDCDSVFVINNRRYRLYEKAAQYILKQNPNKLCKGLIDSYEQSLQEQDIAFGELYKKYIDLDSLSFNTIQATKIDLGAINNSLNGAQTEIKNVNKNLDEVRQIIKEERKRSFLDKVIYAGGGVAAGILAGLILAQ